MARHSLEFVEVYDYVLVDTEANEICLQFSSEDISNNTDKWQYVKNAMETMSKSYKIYKSVPFTFVKE